MAEIVEHIFGAVKKHYVQVANYQKKLHLKDKNKGRVYQKDAEKDAAVMVVGDGARKTGKYCKDVGCSVRDEDEMNVFVRFLLDHETLIQVLMVGPLCVMVFYICIVENGQIF